MAGKKHDTGKLVQTKSFYGSHENMVVNAEEFDLVLKEDEVICEDGDGCYITFRNRLDTGLADPRRFHSASRKVVKKKEKELDKV
jgi:hypothetical protein